MNSVIFSIDGVENPFTQRAFMGYCVQKGIAYKTLIGSYKGLKEVSFLVAEEDFIEYLQDSPGLLNQESVLSISVGYRDVQYATLLYRPSSGRERVYLGRLVEVSEEVALSRQSWTKDPLTGKYFITEKEVE